MPKKRTRLKPSRKNPQARTTGFRQRVPLSDTQKAKIRTVQKKRKRKQSSMRKIISNTLENVY